ncbi:VCBS repeat-containing protein [Spongiimicrobium sp. 3-5]|uniref:VCBS repeat-containing protein n=1 Tax=Spongiimicrobium sp. 3-5 TaxID=3332596 RepID=UPI0039813743
MKHTAIFKILIGLMVVLAFTLASCNQQKTAGQKTFNKLSHEETGISFSNILTENDSLNYFTYSYLYMGGGVSAGDINNDGLIDLFFTGNMVPNKLYLNLGNLKFQDISVDAGVAGDSRWYTGSTMIDINNDGLLDIYCSVGGKYKPKGNQLFLNNGNNTFTEKAMELGIADLGNSVQGTFFDYDRDGDLDLYVANYPPTKFSAPNDYYLFKMDNTKDVETDHLYRNDDGIFTNVTDTAGVRSFGLTLSATAGDLNNDGWPDLYVSNDFSTPDYLYINNQDGTFKEVVKQATKQTSFYGMGVDIADYNNDGRLDIFQVDMDAKDNRRAKANMASMNPAIFWSTVNAGFHYQYMHNSLQLNAGIIADDIPNFSNTSRLAGISSTDWSWGPLFADLDNDGWKDLFISNGTRREINNRDYFIKLGEDRNKRDSLLEKALAIPSEKIDNFVFRNNGDLTFELANSEWGISHKGFSNGCIYVDLDNDGDLEIITNNIDDYASVFENTSASKNNHITLKLKGPAKNPNGIGTKVSLYSNGSRQFQEMTLTRGFQSSVAPQLHFGLGSATIVDSLVLHWPDAKEQHITDIASNQILTLDYTNASEKEYTTIKQPQTTLFNTVKDTSIGVPHLHIENFYNDFVKEILLPHQTSKFGPSVAVGDLNGDTLQDYIVGGASQNKAGVYFQTATGGFSKQFIEAISEDSGYEDLGIHIFDAENDGDNDIYIVSGGNEFSPDSKMLQDRLYLNRGDGTFVKSTDALPIMITSGSRVHSADFDKDGDLDLFVGGRLVPGNYPLPANSYILENRSTPQVAKFVDVTKEIAPSLTQLGMVTDAVWTDYDKDGWTDLLIVGEWMPISVFKNIQGKFENSTEELGLANTTGWWFSIKEGDFDKDGDMDFIVGNLGLNYKYKANENETFDIYFNDFDNNKTNDIVLSYFNGGKKYPLRGRECSSQQMPGIKKKFGDYASFSTATLEDVYTEAYLEKSLHYQVKSFASVYLANDNGQLNAINLPNMAQISCVNQILVDDFDNDTNLDFIIAGNLHSSEVETPRNDAGNGLFLKGDGAGNFLPLESYKTGLLTTGDVKDISLINVKGDQYLLVAKNSDSLQTIKINRPGAKNSSIAQSLPQ